MPSDDAIHLETEFFGDYAQIKNRLTRRYNHGMDDNPYRAPASPVERASKPIWSPLLKAAKRCALLYFAAYTGAIIGNVIGHTPLSPLWYRHAMALGGVVGLGVGVAWLLADDWRAKHGR